ncbi:hypothetical protein BKA66DRAFT_546280 [Pyrenochaeta sp. MPI-SDFR-AT-0127]|nr:hypothetical protein BKA66DRAFT_546280 [Pyrenochaeta sp. MPI-SDFR-AT-0127]
MSKRKAEDDDWELHRDTIMQLYVSDGRTQPEVMQLMAARGFKRTKAQWERKLRNWGIIKNITKEEWKFILNRLPEREAQNKNSTIIVRNFAIPRSRIQKQRRIHEHQKTFERLVNGLQPPVRLATPPGVSVLTPVSSPCPASEANIEIQDMQSVSDDSVSSNFALENIYNTPWQRLLRVIRSWATSQAHMHVVSFHRLNERNRLATPRIEGFTADVIERPNFSIPDVQCWNRSIMLAQYINFEEPVHPIIFDQTAYLPGNQIEFSNNDVKDSYDITETSTYLHTLKVLVIAIANNFGSEEVARLLLQLAKDKSAVITLKRLIDQRLLAASACAEKLLVPAVKQRNCDLVRVLLDSGVDVDYRCPKLGYDQPITTLQYAVEEDDENMVQLLLDRGASDWSAYLCSKTHYIVPVIGTIGECAVIEGHYGILKKLLVHWDQIEGEKPKITSHALVLAVLEHRMDLFVLLLESHKELLDDTLNAPWFLLEAAASCAGVTVFDCLTRLGLDMHAVDERGWGSALPAATVYENMPLIRYLITNGADVNGRAYGSNVILDQGASYGSKETYRFFLGETALNIAVQHNNTNLVRVLLAHGADANQCCKDFPIRIAAKNGNETVVELLLANHANINVIPPATNSELQYHCPETAICIAFRNGFSHVVDALYKFGAKLPPRDPDVSYYAFDDPFELIMEQEINETAWDPWAIAIEKRDIQFLQHAIQKQYSDQSLTTSHLCRLIVIHGSILAQNVLQKDILTLDIAIHPIILYAAINRGDELLVSRLWNKLVKSSRNNDFAQRYGFRALSMAVLSSHHNLIHFFLDTGLNPFEGYHYAQPWIPHRELSHEMEWHRSSAFQLAEQCADIMGVFLSWKPIAASEEQQRSRNCQLTLAYINAVCSKNTELEHMILHSSPGVKNIDQSLVSGSMHRFLVDWLCYTIEQKHYDLARWLITIGADPNCVSNITSSSHTALQLAVRINEVALVRMLLHKGANVNAKPSRRYGATAIQYAAINGNFEIFNLLLQAGADINAKPAQYGGRTAIEGAAEWGRLDMTYYLLELGADIQGRENQTYRRAIHRAWNNGHHTLARMIQDWKKKKYGIEDCEDIERIMKTVSKYELYHADPASDSDEESEMSDEY